MRWPNGHQTRSCPALDAGTIQSPTLCLGAVREPRTNSLKCFLRPLSFGLIGLAIALILWGLAYRLSLYRAHQSHNAKVSVAKLSGPVDAD
jgi:hypothetical protein